MANRGERLGALKDVLRAQAEPWRADAACRGRTAVMYPTPGDAEGQCRARAICARCPVLEPCRCWALGPERLQGAIAGGLSESQRARLRKRLREAV